MDLRQLFHRKTFYVMVVALSAMTLSMLFLADPSALTMGNVLGILDGISMDNFMSAASGLGLGYTLMCIMLSFFVCDDFSSGFAKNIFTVHANKRDYIASKVVSMMIATGILMLISLIEGFVYASMSGIVIGNIGGILMFAVGKWILSAAFASAILFVSILFRNKGLGFLFACLFGTGGIVMGIVWALSAIHFPYTSQVLSWTMYGASTIPSLNMGIMDLLRVVLVTVLWVVIYGLLSAKLLREKDI